MGLHTYRRLELRILDLTGLPIDPSKVRRTIVSHHPGLVRWGRYGSNNLTKHNPFEILRILLHIRYYCLAWLLLPPKWVGNPINLSLNFSNAAKNSKTRVIDISTLAEHAAKSSPRDESTASPRILLRNALLFLSGIDRRLCSNSTIFPTSPTLVIRTTLPPSSYPSAIATGPPSKH